MGWPEYVRGCFGSSEPAYRRLARNHPAAGRRARAESEPERFCFWLRYRSEPHKGRGSVATVLVDRGTLKTGDVVVAGTSYGKVRARYQSARRACYEAHPADPVEILGLNSVPTAGDEFRVFEDERDARRLAEQRALRERLAKQESRSHMNLDDLFARIEEGKTTDLNLSSRPTWQARSKRCVDGVREDGPV